MKFAKGLACAGLLLIVPIILFGQDWERFKASQSLPNDDVAAFLERLCKQSGKPSIHSIAWTASASTRKVAVEEFSYYSKEKAVLYERKNVPVENFNIDTGKYSGAITEHGELYTPDGIFVRSPIISELTACTSNGILLRNTPDSYEYRRAFYKNAAYPKQILEHLSPKSMRGFIYMREAIKYMLKQGCGDEGTLAQISKAEDELVKRGKFEGRIGNFDIKAFLTDNGCIESFRL